MTSYFLPLLRDILQCLKKVSRTFTEKIWKKIPVKLWQKNWNLKVVCIRKK